MNQRLNEKQYLTEAARKLQQIKKEPRCSYCVSGQDFKPTKVLENGQQICRKLRPYRVSLRYRFPVSAPEVHGSSIISPPSAFEPLIEQKRSPHPIPKRKTAGLTGSSVRRFQSSNSLLSSDALRLTKRHPHYV
jgi:hypothetical protein